MIFHLLRSKAIRLKWMPLLIWKSTIMKRPWTVSWSPSLFSSKLLASKTLSKLWFTVKRSANCRHSSALVRKASQSTMLTALQWRMHPGWLLRSSKRRTKLQAPPPRRHQHKTKMRKWKARMLKKSKSMGASSHSNPVNLGKHSPRWLRLRPK